MKIPPIAPGPEITWSRRRVRPFRSGGWNTLALGLLVLAVVIAALS